MEIIGNFWVLERLSHYITDRYDTHNYRRIIDIEKFSGSVVQIKKINGTGQTSCA